MDARQLIMRKELSGLKNSREFIHRFRIICACCLILIIGKALAKATDDADNIPARLGWVSVPAIQNICCGYFLDPLNDFGDKPLPPLTTTPIAINAEKGTFYQEGTSLLIGNVTLSQPGRLVNAEQILIHRDPKQQTPVTADLYGNVTLREPGKFITGDSAHIELHSKAAHFMHTLYRMILSAEPNAVEKAKTNDVLTAWGKADKAEQDKQGLIKLSKTIYTTCAPTSNTWFMHAKTIVLNRDTGRGYAYNSWLTVKDVPVFYTPYFDFPIDKRRQSGFLFPSIGSSSNSGFNFTVPYYWNIAPNYDDLITPHFYSKRGVLMENTFRYLTSDSSGHISAGLLPDDAAFSDFQREAETKYAGNPALGRLLHSSNDRNFFSWQDNRSYDAHWSSAINYNSVSDDYYLQDFPTKDIRTSNTSNQLPRSASVNYAGENWNFNGLLQTYQTLHAVNQSAVSNPYNMLPQLNWNGNYPNATLGLQYEFNNQFTYFERAQNPGEITPAPAAARTHIQPGVSLPLNGLSGFIRPALQLDLTHYDIGSQFSGFNNNIQRNIPIFSIDSGLFFDRDATFAGHGYQQTLEPRLFYLYVPYRNQNNIPLFDAGIVPFTYDSLFMTNRFSGLDRIGDANQIAYALTTRLLDDATGAEKFRASIGEIYYFKDRDVSLCVTGSTTNCLFNNNINPLTAIGSTSPTEKFSPLAGQLAYNFNPAWSATANAAWDPKTDETINSSVNLRYSPALNHILNLTYNYIRFGDTITAAPGQPAIPPESHQNDLNQASLSFAWPVKERWNAVGGYTYNVNRKYPQTYFYGLEYDSCCWAVRLVAGRNFSGLNQNNTPIFNNAIYLQWQFKGLSNIGTADPSAFLLDNIPGYRDQFQPFKGSIL